MSISFAFLLGTTISIADEKTTEQINATIKIYQESCSVCHGDDGKGAVWGQQSLSTPPRDFTTAVARQELDRERMIASVTYGRPGTPMPGFGSQLNATQVAAIVDYVRARFMAPHVAGHAPLPQSHSAITPGTEHRPDEYHARSFPNDLQGKFENGRSIYFTNCIECHGELGDGDGPRAYFIFPKPRNFLDSATQQILNRPRLYAGVRDGVIGKEMPAWRFVLTDQEIADVAEFVYQEFIRAKTGSDPATTN
jgi:mono/diheme cytochrome c family protein